MKWKYHRERSVAARVMKLFYINRLGWGAKAAWTKGEAAYQTKEGGKRRVRLHFRVRVGKRARTGEDEPTTLKREGLFIIREQILFFLIVTTGRDQSSWEAGRKAQQLWRGPYYISVLSLWRPGGSWRNDWRAGFLFNSWLRVNYHDARTN